MKYKMTIVTDTNGEFIGSVRTDPIKDGTNTLQFFPSPHPDHTHHEVEVEEEVMRKPFDEAREILLSQISDKQ